jgi:hypothetical protein
LSLSRAIEPLKPAFFTLPWYHSCSLATLWIWLVDDARGEEEEEGEVAFDRRDAERGLIRCSCRLKPAYSPLCVYTERRQTPSPPSQRTKEEEEGERKEEGGDDGGEREACTTVTARKKTRRYALCALGFTMAATRSDVYLCRSQLDN